jgi:hypothetical protein
MGSTGTSGGIFQACGPGSLTCSGIGFYYGAEEMTISGSDINNNKGPGIELDGATNVSVNALNIQGNGLGQYGGAGIVLNNASEIAICGNHMLGNGGDVPNSPSAQIYFSGTIDGLTATRVQRLVADV